MCWWFTLRLRWTTWYIKNASSALTLRDLIKCIWTPRLPIAFTDIQSEHDVQVYAARPVLLNWFSNFFGTVIHRVLAYVKETNCIKTASFPFSPDKAVMRKQIHTEQDYYPRQCLSHAFLGAYYPCSPHFLHSSRHTNHPKPKDPTSLLKLIQTTQEVTPSDALSDTLSLLLSFPLNQVMGFISILSSDVPSFAAILTATFVSSGLTAYFALKSSNSSPILSVLVVITALTSAFITACLAFLYTRHRFVAACARERAYGRQEQRDRYRYDRDVWEVDRMEIGLVEVGAAPLLESETPSKEETELKNVREAEQEQVLEADLWVVGEDQEEDEEEDAGFEWEEVL